jgi:conjugal transfer pilus assembly protein TraF
MMCAREAIMRPFYNFIFPIIMSSSVIAHDSFYNRHSEGWFWYQESGIGNQESEKPAKLDDNPSNSLEAYKKKLEQTLHQALMNPTEQNVKAYMTNQKDMMERAEAFSRVWQKMVITNPNLNRDVAYPTSQYVRPIYEAQVRHKKEATMAGLSATFGLFYFFKEGCSYCTAFAPIVKRFSEKYGWDVMAISVDGSSSEVFPKAQEDQGMVAALGIESLPALVAYNAQTQELVPISYASISLDQLEDNVLALVGEKS